MVSSQQARSARPSPTTRPVPSTVARATSLALLGLVVASTLPLAEAFQLSPAAPSSVDALVSQFGLSQTFTLPRPSRALASSQAGSYLKENWSLNRQQIQAGANYLSFTDDPFDSSSSDAVIEVDYEQGSFGGDGKGGAQFYAQPLNGSSAPLSSMLLSYDVGFSPGFAFSQGGKLPGLRGGPDPRGCSGGHEADGASCFSSRLMWRAAGAGEVYAYIPTKGYGLCTASDVTCNSDYGTSLSRGSFRFATDAWTSIDLFVQLNNPPSVANGRVFLYANGTLALAHDNLQLRSSDAITSVGGLFFSTFFGGADISWASPANQSSYYRNFRLRGSSAVSDGTGKTVGSAGWRQAGLPSVAGAALLGVVGFAFAALA